jgi:hypothetical protein
MGYGDFKLLGALGAWMGWQMLPLIILFSAFAGAVVGIVLIAVRGRDRNIPIPFGPYLAAAGWIALMWGPQIVGGTRRSGLNSGGRSCNPQASFRWAHRRDASQDHGREPLQRAGAGIDTDVIARRRGAGSASPGGVDDSVCVLDADGRSTGRMRGGCRRSRRRPRAILHPAIRGDGASVPRRGVPVLVIRSRGRRRDHLDRVLVDVRNADQRLVRRDGTPPAGQACAHRRLVTTSRSCGRHQNNTGAQAAGGQVQVELTHSALGLPGAWGASDGWRRIRR